MIYFAYGSNLHPGQMYERCPDHETIGIAKLPKYRLTFPRYSQVRFCATAGIETHATESVWGVLYRLSEADVAMLHYHEGYDPEGPEETNRHTLDRIQVARPGATVPQTAMTYVAVGDGTRERPSADYLETIVYGAKYHGLPRAWLMFLETIPTG